jgi:multisubunit Na+/H+ antiporter MnhG subunit
MRDVIAWVLLAAGGGLQLFAVAGVVLLPDALDRLHFVAPSSLAAVFIAAAIVVRESFSQIGIYAMLLAAFLLFTGPTLAHVTARVIVIARRRSQ